MGEDLDQHENDEGRSNPGVHFHRILLPSVGVYLVPFERFPESYHRLDLCYFTQTTVQKEVDYRVFCINPVGLVVYATHGDVGCISHAMLIPQLIC